MATADADEQHSRELRPFREQEPFLQRDKKYYGYISGVGAGKTFAGVLRVALNMEEWNPGEMGAIVAPTTTMIKDVILPLMRETGLLDHWEYKSAHTDEPGIHAPNGSRALILSADNTRTIERLAGLNLAWFWIDEGPRTDKRALEILTQRLRVGAYRNGFITGTPKGKNHIYDFFVGGVDGDLETHGVADVYAGDDRLALLRVPTHANPHTPEDYKTQMDRDFEGQTYEQEILGKFVKFEGLVYPWFSEDSHVIQQAPENVRRVFYGVDWGHNNPAAIEAVGETGDGRLVVLDEFYGSGLDYDQMVEAAEDMQARNGEGRFYCDPSEPAAIQMFQRAGLDASGAENDIMPGIQYVSAQRDQLYVVERCTNLINQFGMYHYDENSDKEKPVDKNDHALDSLRYALFSDAQGGAMNVGVAFG